MAMRLARTYTDKNKVLKFTGHFHGWHDSLILGAYPPFDVPVPGIPQEVRDTTLLCPPNDIGAVENLLKSMLTSPALSLNLPVRSFGIVPTDGVFLRQLRELTAAHGVLLIFDEVITGFRVAPGGAQAYYDVTPDLTTLAKILAEGFPAARLSEKRRFWSSFQCSPRNAV